MMKHSDCIYFVNIDVFKGMCKRDKNIIKADDKACDYFERGRKCKFCSHFQLIEEETGTCMDTYDAYPEMFAVTCYDFTES